MKEKKLLRALGNVDNQYIKEAEPMKKTSKITNRQKWVSVAACFVLVVVIGVGVFQSNLFGTKNDIATLECDMGERVAKSLMSTAFTDWIELSSEYSMAEVAIPEKWVGKSLSELKIREQYGINAVGIIQGEKVEVTLDPYAPLPKDAILILIGATAVLEKFHTWK